MVILNREGLILEVNDVFTESLALNKEEIILQPLNKFSPELWTLLSQGKSLLAGKLKREGDSAIPVEGSAKYFDNKIYLTLENCSLNNELREQSDLFNLVLKATKIANWSWNPQTNRVEYDIEWFKQIQVVDLGTGELSWVDALHPDDLLLVKEKMEEHLKGKTPTFECVMRFKSTSGKYKQILAKGKITRYDENGRALKMSGVHIDVSEMLELKNKVETSQASLIHNAKMASIGEIAGGIAHEVNTPLTVILGATNVIKSLNLSKKENVDRAFDMLDRSKKAAEKIGHIVAELRTLAKDSSTEELLKETSVNSLITQALALCQERCKNHEVKVEISCPENLKIRGQVIPITQAILSLMTNAREAVCLKSNDRWIKVIAEEQNKRVKIKVIDSGSGIRRELREKLFTPLFTTKPQGQGAGLGLSVAKGTVEKNHGQIYFDPFSKETTFIIDFPSI